MKIVCVGAGGIMRNAHLPAYRKAGFEVAAIYDTHQETAQAVADEFQIPLVANAIQDLPSDGIYDFATPAAALPALLEAIPDGSWCLLQKPMGENLAQAQEILEICERKGHKAAVNFQLRWAPYSLALKQVLAEGKIGEIVDVDIKVNVLTPWAIWYFLELAPRMEIVYHSIHYIDFVRDLLGEPKHVWARAIKHPDSPKLESSRSSIYLDYGDSLRATINTYHAHKGGPKYQESYIKVEGTKGCVRVQMGLNLNYPSGGEDLCELWTESSGEWESLPFDGSWIPDAFEGPMRAMMAWRDGGEAPPTEVHNAIKTMSIVERAYQASDKFQS